MKKILILITCFFYSLITMAQLPQEFSYQAVARNAAGVIIANQTISVRFTIHRDVATGAADYTETRSLTTNQFGLFTVAIGSAGATNVSGSIANINWENSPHFLQVEMDPSGGSSFTNMGSFKMLSVPYAMHAGSSASDKWNPVGNNIYNNNSGNVGIGTSAPNFPLSFSQSLGDKLSLWSNSSTTSYGFGIQSSLLQIHTDVPGADIAFGYGSSTSFTENMRIRGNGNVGIGAANPTAPLTLGSSLGLGKKIILYPGSVGDAGFGVFPSELRIASDFPGAAITFGTDDRGLGFTERMRMNGNGNIGIGNNNPAFQLDVSNRVRIRSGGDNTVSAGLWLNNNSNNLASFVGMEDDTHVGFYGNNGALWRFSMNTQTGALKINGSEGAAGQVLKSNGASAPSWSSPTNSLYNNTVQRNAPTDVSVNNNFEITPLPGLSYTFSTTGNAKVVVMFNVDAYPGDCVNCGATTVTLHVFVDGNDKRSWEDIVGNGTMKTISGSYLVQLGPGTHTIDIRGEKSGPSTYFCSGYATYANNMMLQIIAE